MVSMPDQEGNLWIKAGVNPYLMLLDDTTGKGAYIRYDSTAGSDEGFSFGAMNDEAAGTLLTAGIFFDVIEDRISISNAAFSDMDAAGLLIQDSADPQIRLRIIGSDDYNIHNDAGTLKITNYTDVRDDIQIFEDGDVEIATRLGVAVHPSTTLHTSSDVANELRLDQHSDNVTAPFLLGRKSRGTAASPTTVLDGDDCITIQGHAYNGSSYIQMGSFEIDTQDITGATEDGRIFFRVMGAGTLRVPLEIDAAQDYQLWRTPADNVERMRLTPIGLGIGGTATSRLHTFGSFATAIRTATATTTLDATDVTLIGDTTVIGSFTVNLPAVSGISGRRYEIKNTGFNAAQVVTVDGSGAETIDGSATVVVAFGDSITIQTDGVEWFII